MFRMFWLKPMDSPLNCAASLHLLPPPTPIFSFLNQPHLSYIITAQFLSLSPLQLVLYNLLGFSPLQDFRKAVLQKFFWVPQCLCFMPNYYPLNSPWPREEILLKWNNLMRSNRLDSCFSLFLPDFEDEGRGHKHTIKQKLSDWVKSKIQLYAVHKKLTLNIKTLIL